jgi:hypothetical protein
MTFRTFQSVIKAAKLIVSPDTLLGHPFSFFFVPWCFGGVGVACSKVWQTMLLLLLLLLLAEPTLVLPASQPARTMMYAGQEYTYYRRTFVTFVDKEQIFRAATPFTNRVNK